LIFVESIGSSLVQTDWVMVLGCEWPIGPLMLKFAWYFLGISRMIYVLKWRFIFRVLKGWPNGIVL
jgi:hypothetical protein